MAVTITKKKTTPTKKVSVKQTAQGQMAELVDELGELHEQIEAINVDLEPLLKKYAKTEAELIKWVDEMATPDEKRVVEGKAYEADVGMMGNATSITNIKKLFNLFRNLGDDVVFDLMKFNIGDIRKYLTPKEVEDVTETKRSSKRKVKVSKLL